MIEKRTAELMDAFAKYLKMEKVFIQNPARMKTVNAATEIAYKLFPEANITLEDDPLQMGAIFLCIEDVNLVIREPKFFTIMVHSADNFEICRNGDENMKITIMFGNALKQIET